MCRGINSKPVLGTIFEPQPNGDGFLKGFLRETPRQYLVLFPAPFRQTFARFQQCPFTLFWGRVPLLKYYRRKGTLILTSLLEDLVCEEFMTCPTIWTFGGSTKEKGPIIPTFVKGLSGGIPKESRFPLFDLNQIRPVACLDMGIEGSMRSSWISPRSMP